MADSLLGQLLVRRAMWSLMIVTLTVVLQIPVFLFGDCGEVRVSATGLTPSG